MGLVARWLQETLEFVEIAADRPHNPYEHDRELERLDDETAEYRQQLGTGDYADAEPRALDFLKQEGLQPDRSSPGYRRFLQLLTRAKIEVSRMQRARLLGDFTYEPADPAVRAAFSSG